MKEKPFPASAAESEEAATQKQFQVPWGKPLPLSRLLPPSIPPTLQLSATLGLVLFSRCDFGLMLVHAEFKGDISF